MRRTPTAIDAVAEQYVDRLVDLSPLHASALGVPGRHDELDDLSPAGFAALSDLRRDTLRRLDAEQPADRVDQVTVEAMRERLLLAEEMHGQCLDLASLNILESPLQHLRDIVDIMPMETDEDWQVIGRRLRAVPEALRQWDESLRAAAAAGRVAPRRQILACIRQAEDIAGPSGFYDALLRRSASATERTRELLTEGTDAARAGYAQAAGRLRDLLPSAPEADACGRDTYQLCSRSFLGARIDLDEAYAWGQSEVARITDEMVRVAGEIRPGATPAEACALLDADPRYRLEGSAALRDWMQERAEHAISALAGTHFDIPGPVQRIECRIAESATGGIYYTPPSDDFSRPGRMWWSIPPDVTTFGTWRELSTVYHEGVPGHHLQVGQTAYRSDVLNRWRRHLCATSGHAEGWALYAERLMAELGFIEEAGHRMGLLDAQSLRAARVVLDIGVHCGLPAPDEVGGGAWTYDKAWAYLNAHANAPASFLRFELDRYLGWPGQAPSYKIGERTWLELREEVRRRKGDAFDLREFHREALEVGCMGLDTLRAAVLQ